MNQLVPHSSAPILPALVAAGGEQTARRFVEFFTANIRNRHTREAYGRAVNEFLAWCERQGIQSLAAVEPIHVATWIEMLAGEVSAPTVKQKLAALRHLFDWLVVGQVIAVNPAASVRGPKHSARKGRTPVLEPTEARKLLDSINVSTPAGLRDRALIALMLYTFARVVPRSA
jgi:integrase/recombinase XerC